MFRFLSTGTACRYVVSFLNCCTVLTSVKIVPGLVSAGVKGGQQAARTLKVSVRAHILDAYPEIPAGFRILVQVYANNLGLANAYFDADVIRDLSDLAWFVRAFNMNELADWVDSGDGKERADTKLKDTLVGFSGVVGLDGC
jgi:hypothetical protein